MLLYTVGVLFNIFLWVYGGEFNVELTILQFCCFYIDYYTWTSIISLDIILGLCLVFSDEKRIIISFRIYNLKLS